MVRPAPRRLPGLAALAAVAALAASTPVAATAATASNEPDERVDAVIATFTDVVTDAGFVLGGDPQDIDDPLGLTEDDDSTTLDDCLPDDDGIVADDGTFLGQLAGKISGAHYLTGDEPLDTANLGGFEYPTIAAAVAIVDDSATAGLHAVVGELASEEFAGCIEAAAEEWTREREADAAEGTAIPQVSVTVSAEALEIGDAAARFGIVESAVDDDGETRSLVAQLATAVVDDVIVIIGYTSLVEDGSPGDEDDIVAAALSAAIDANN